MATENVSKLPKWAQHRIARAEREIESLAERLRRAYPKSNMLLDHYGENPVFLPQDANVTFRMDDFDEDGNYGAHARYIQARIDRDSRGNSWLYLMGGTYVMVQPQSSNTVKIFLDDR